MQGPSKKWFVALALVTGGGAACDDGHLIGRRLGPATAGAEADGGAGSPQGGSGTDASGSAQGGAHASGSAQGSGDAEAGGEGGAAAGPIAAGSGGSFHNEGGGGAAEAGSGTQGGESGSPCELGDCPAWEQVGGSLPPSYSFAIAAAPSEVGVVYTGNYSHGGVFKTTNSGVSWSSVKSGLDDLAVRSLAVDPFDADNVWVGTPTGLYRSTNAGGQWTKVSIDDDHPIVWWITADPVVEGRVYVLLQQDVSPSFSAAYVSNDGGLTWEPLDSPGNFRGHTLDVDSSDPNHLFLGTYGQGVFESHDGGSTFAPLPNPPDPDSTFQVVYEPSANILCAVTTDGIARSTDGGASWQTQLGIPAYLLTLAPGPTFYLNGNSGVHRSTDCSDWVRVDQYTGYRAVVDAAGAVYAATVGAGAQGVRRSPDGVSAFESVNQGITTADVMGLAVDPTASDALFVSATSNGILRTTDGAASFASATGNLPGVGTTGFPSGLLYTGQTLFAFARNFAGRFYRSDDQGSTWQSTLLSLPDSRYALVADMLVSPTFDDDDTVYIGTRSSKPPAVSLEQSLDGGTTFTPRGNGDFATIRMIWDKAHDGWMWALGTPDSATIVLYLSQDRGLTWSPVTLPVQGDYAALDGATTPTGEVLYIPVNGKGVLRSEDSGSSWQLMGKPPGDYTRAFVVDPSNPQTLYLATAPDSEEPGERGLFKSRDGGATWSRADRGIEWGEIRSLVIQPNNPQILYAGMAYGGLYKTLSGGE